MSFWTVGLSRVLTSFCTWNNVYIFYIYGFLLCEGNLITNVCRTGVSGWRLQLDCFKLQCDVIVNRQISLNTAHIRLDVFVYMHDSLPKHFFFFYFIMLLFGSNMPVFLLHINCMRRFNSQLDAVSQSGLHLYWTFRRSAHA